jgi:hypothetical protein
MPRSRLLALFVFLGICAGADARPPHKKALADHFGPFLPNHLNDCRTCHLPDKPGEKVEEGKPHNAFGARLETVRRELKKAGKATGIPARVAAIAKEDSDGDGTPNLVELLAGRNPGEKEDRPTEPELSGPAGCSPPSPPARPTTGSRSSRSCGRKRPGSRTPRGCATRSTPSSPSSTRHTASSRGRKRRRKFCCGGSIWI